VRIFSKTFENTVSILEKYLGIKGESAHCKAILIGYKVDLDKDLVQACSNAGVVQVDHIIISKNPRLKISSPAKNFDCENYIFDASNSPRKIEKWKKECEELHLHFHSVAEQGAFVINF